MPPLHSSLSIRDVIQMTIRSSFGGVILGLCITLDPLLPALQVEQWHSIRPIVAPIIVPLRLLVLLGPIAALFGSLSGYKLTKHTHCRRDGLVISVFYGIRMATSCIVCCSILFWLIATYPSVQQQLLSRADQLAALFGMGRNAGAPGIPATSFVFLVGGGMAVALAIFNFVISVGSGAIGSWLADQSEPKMRAG